MVARLALLTAGSTALLAFWALLLAVAALWLGMIA